MKPGEFPLGSLESRALAQRQHLSDEEFGCLLIYNWTVYCTAQVSPDYSQIEPTIAYQRGKEISERRNGPVVPAHDDPHYKRSTTASLAFEQVNGREPRAGDILTRAEYEAHRQKYYADVYPAWREAWDTLMGGLPCPLKLEDGKLYGRLRAGQAESWKLVTATDALSVWRSIAGKANAPCDAVVFGDLLGGVHNCRPYSPSVE